VNPLLEAGEGARGNSLVRPSCRTPRSSSTRIGQGIHSVGGLANDADEEKHVDKRCENTEEGNGGSENECGIGLE
jgi:hypothetical protein